MKKPLGASVHPFSHKLEWGGGSPLPPRSGGLTTNAPTAYS